MPPAARRTGPRSRLRPAIAMSAGRCVLSPTDRKGIRRRRVGRSFPCRASRPGPSPQALRPARIVSRPSRTASSRDAPRRPAPRAGPQAIDPVFPVSMSRAAPREFRSATQGLSTTRTGDTRDARPRPATRPWTPCPPTPPAPPPDPLSWACSGAPPEFRRTPSAVSRSNSPAPRPTTPRQAPPPDAPRSPPGRIERAFHWAGRSSPRGPAAPLGRSGPPGPTRPTPPPTNPAPPPARTSRPPSLSSSRQGVRKSPHPQEASVRRENPRHPCFPKGLEDAPRTLSAASRAIRFAFRR